MVKGQGETHASGTGGDTLQVAQRNAGPAQAKQTLPQPLTPLAPLHMSLSTGSSGGSQMWGNSAPHRPPGHAWEITKWPLKVLVAGFWVNISVFM